jgi:hypothetical protein
MDLLSLRVILWYLSMDGLIGVIQNLLIYCVRNLCPTETQTLKESVAALLCASFLVAYAFINAGKV